MCIRNKDETGTCARLGARTRMAHSSVVERRTMPRAFKVVMLVVLLVVIAFAGVIVGCGSNSSSSSSSSSPSASADTSKAYKIGITQIVTHPALDAAVAGFTACLLYTSDAANDLL